MSYLPHIRSNFYSASLSVYVIFVSFASNVLAESPVPYLVKEIRADVDPGIREPVRYRDLLYFRANDGINGSELWQSDGTEEGTVLFYDFKPGGSNPREMVVHNGLLYLVAPDNSDGNRDKIWRSDGTVEGTYPLYNDTDGTRYLNPEALTPAGAQIFFIAAGSGFGTELWCTDGTSEGTRIVRDIVLEGSSELIDLVAFGASVAFLNSLPEDDTRVFPWISDGTEEGTVPILSSPPFDNFRPRELEEAGDRLFFRAGNGGGSEELWTSDGTAVGTQVVIDLNDSPAYQFNSLPDKLTRVGDLLFFEATSPEASREVFRSDGTAEGTFLLKDINLNVPSLISGLSFPDLITDAGHGGFFIADDGVRGFEPYYSDGTSEGTLLLKDIHDEDDSRILAFEVVHGYAYFNAVESNEEERLWRSDGTVVGTSLYPVPLEWELRGENFVAANGLMFFEGVLAGGTYLDLWAVDIPPIVESIDVVGANPTNAQSVDFTVPFSEEVDNVDASDFVLTGAGTSGAFISNVVLNAPDNKVATVTVDTGTGDGTIGLALVDDNSIMDVGSLSLGGLGTEVGDFEGVEQYMIDKTAPETTISLATKRSGVGQVRDLSVEFTEEVNGLTLEAFVLSNATAEDLSGTGDTYTLQITPLAAGEVIVQLPADSASDAAGNGNTESNLYSFLAEQEGEGEGEGGTEGEGEGTPDGEGEGTSEGHEEGSSDGEGEPDGEVPVIHTADQDGDSEVSLSELLRVIQFFNSDGFGCEEGTEDGYAPNDPDQTCVSHASDYNPQDWEVSLSELLRLIQFFNSGGYNYCPDEDPVTEDEFCPGSD